MDRPRQLVRNSKVHPQAAIPLIAAESATPNSGLMVDVVVLSGDLALFEAIRHAVGERNPVWRARSAAESVELLLTGRCGVLLVDMAAVSTQPATLIAQIVAQFPDIVVVVAGRRDDESLLAQLISEGHVYRFMHKPLSPKRAGMFLNTAIRNHLERRHGRVVEPLLPIMAELRSRIELRRWLFVTAGLALLLILLGILLLGGSRLQRLPDVSRAAVPSPASATRTSADPVLSAARAALAARRYESPPGRNALDLYAAVLLARPEHPEARAGLDETTARLVALALSAAQTGNVDEARRLLRRLRAIDADHPATQALQARLDAPPPAVAAPPVTVAPVPARNPSPVRPPSAPAATPRVRPPVPAARSPATIAVPLAAPRPERAAPVRVMPDPLTPRIAAPAVAQSPRSTASRAAGSAFGPPISSGHAIAGYVKEPSAARSEAYPDPVTPDNATGALPDADLEQLAATEPVYPLAALRQRIEGWVEVDFTVTESGGVRDIEVVEAEPRGVFEEAATAAVRQWRFRPRVANGRPVQQRSTVTLRFNVEG